MCSWDAQTGEEEEQRDDFCTVAGPGETVVGTKNKDIFLRGEGDFNMDGKGKFLLDHFH